MKKSRNTDFLSQRNANIRKYTHTFDNAVSMVSNAILNLTETNRGIREEINLIAKYQAELEAARLDMQDKMAKNETVIKNFSALLGLDVEEVRDCEECSGQCTMDDAAAYTGV